MVVARVKKDIEDKNSLDNELTSMSRDSLLKCNPSVLVSKDVYVNFRSHDAYVKQAAIMILDKQLRAIQNQRAAILIDF